MNATQTDSDETTCLAIYGWNSRLDRRAWAVGARAIEAALNIKFSCAYVSAGDRTYHGTVTSAEEKVSAGRGDGVTYLVRPNVAFDSGDWHVCFSVLAAPSDVTFVGLRRREGLTDFVRAALAAFAPHFGSPPYGIGYHRSIAQGPEAFAFGMNYTIGPMTIGTDEGDRTSAWLFDITSSETEAARLRYRKGYLRDVFPVNLLADVHLSFPMEGTTLGNWIRQAECHGDLTQLESGGTMWCVPDDYRGNVRAVLAENGVFFDRKLQG